MSYCTDDDVRLHIAHGMDPDDVARLIQQADAELDTMLGSHSMSTDLKKRCSSLLTAIMIARRLPKNYTVGTARVTHGDRGPGWRRTVDELVATVTGGKFHVVSSEYQKIDEKYRYPL